METSTDVDIVRGFLVQLETQKSLTAHNVDYNRKKREYRQATEEVVRTQCYVFALQALRYTLDDEVFTHKMTPLQALDGFCFYMNHLMKRSLKGRADFDESTQLVLYKTFTIMADTYEKIAFQAATTKSMLMPTGSKIA